MSVNKTGNRVALQNLSQTKPTAQTERVQKQLIRTGRLVTVGHGCDDRFELPGTGVLNSTHAPNVPGARNLRSSSEPSIFVSLPASVSTQLGRALPECQTPGFPGPISLPRPDVFPTPESSQLPLPGPISFPRPDVFPTPESSQLPFPGPISFPRPDVFPTPETSQLPFPGPISFPRPDVFPLPPTGTSIGTSIGGAIGGLGGIDGGLGEIGRALGGISGGIGGGFPALPDTGVLNASHPSAPGTYNLVNDPSEK